ncbi:monovalent cation/H(+) antiporter subunit G [Sporosarcina thermotolerans]|uniref:Monovalent cation/H(+) antiporter subunit G n=1 Tax=Sporosarcina thermotolerans TaxID=633404 RepID=A0AAW9A837_9BACL|nr:monovalent cation/H(+) antiporter subunit G [Sporosarcina thermotolerans]MDW0117597.1 monovalent cation/H(+) antiporter subunit G [Sporosarcina thermotolerans]
MIVIANILIVTTIVVGIIFTIVTMIGILRLPDVYTRAHAASKSATLGVLSILLGVFLHFWLKEGHFSIQLLLGILFLFITSPVGGHLMGRAAYMSGVKPTDETVDNDLKEAVEEAKKKNLQRLKD